MSDQYQEIADIYDTSLQEVPLREHVELVTVLRAVGDVQGKSVLDLACGTGLYARLLRKRGAGRVLGVDISPDMIRLARAAEEAEPLGIEYRIQDVAELTGQELFDCAVGVYLLHYASSREQLWQMCRAIASALAPGARFTTYAANPEFHRRPGFYTKYGLNLHVPAELADGGQLAFALILGNVTTPAITIYHWTRATMEAALREAGFTDLRWHPPEVSERGLALYGREYWQDYLEHPQCITLTCTRK